MKMVSICSSLPATPLSLRNKNIPTLEQLCMYKHYVNFCKYQDYFFYDLYSDSKLFDYNEHHARYWMGNGDDLDCYKLCFSDFEIVLRPIVYFGDDLCENKWVSNLEFSKEWFRRVNNARPDMWFLPTGEFRRSPDVFEVSFPFYIFLRDTMLCKIKEYGYTSQYELERLFLSIANDLPSYHGPLFEIDDGYEYAGEFFQLLRSGDVEMNPGPVQSKLLRTRYNNPSVRRQCELHDKKVSKVATLLQKLRADIKAQRNSGIECQSWSKNLSSFFGAPKKITAQADKLIDFLECQLPQMENRMLDTIKHTWEKIDEWKSDVAILILVVLLIYLLFKGEYYKSAILVILSSIGYFFKFPQCIKDLFRELREAIAEWGKKLTRKVPHVSAEEVVYHPWFGICGRLLFAVLAFVGIKAIPGKKDWDSYILRLDRVPKALEGTKKITAYCTEYFNLATDQLKMLVLNKDKTELGHVHALYSEIREWAATVHKYMDLTERRKLDVDSKLANEVQALYRRGLIYQTKGITDTSINALISATLFPARTLYEYVAASPVKGGGMRMRAVTLWLKGGSGLGKSLITYPICIELLRTMGLNKTQDYGPHVFARYTETEYWDGYHDQKIVVYDDAFQRTDDVVNPNPEIFEVIRSCNEFPQHVHMAALQDKNTYSNAEVLIYTSNTRDIKIKSITHPAAFYSRMSENAYDILPAPGYEKREELPNGNVSITLDKEQLDLSNGPIDYKAYVFQKMKHTEDPDHPWISDGEPITFDQLTDRLCKKWKAESQRGFELSKHLKERLQRPLVSQVGGKKTQFSSATCEDLHIFGGSNTTFRSGLPPVISSRMVDCGVPEIPAYRPRPVNITSVDTSVTGDNPATVENCPDLLELTDETLDKHMTSDALYKLFNADVILKIAKGMTIDEIEYEYQARSKVFAYYLVYRDQFLKNHTAEDKLTKWEKFSQRIENAMESTKDTLVKCARKVRDVLAAHPILSILGVLGTVLTAYGIYESIQWMQKKDEDDDDDVTISSEMGVSGGHKTRQQQRVKVHAAEQLRLNMIAQNGTDYSAYALVTDCLIGNTYEMSYMGKDVNGEDERIPMGNCVFLKGWNFLMPYHYLQTIRIRNLPIGTKILFSNPHSNDVFSLPADWFFVRDTNREKLSDRVRRLKFSDGTYRDAVIVQAVGTSVPLHRDVTKHFIRTDEQSKIQSMGSHLGTITTYRRADSKGYDKVGPSYIWVQNLKPQDSEIEIEKPTRLTDNECTGTYTQRQTYEYDGPTNFGDCGAIVAIFNTRLVHKFVGMHIAGSQVDYKAYGCPLTYEIIKEAIDSFDTNLKVCMASQAYFELPKQSLASTLATTPQGVFIPLTRSSVKVGASSKSAIIPSVLQGHLRDTTTRPALLKPTKIDGELVDPLAKALMKSGGRTEWIDEDDLQAAAEDVARLVLTSYNKTVDIKKYQRLLDYEECVRGTLDDQFMKAVARNTSPGFPYMQQTKGLPGKQRWMGVGESFDFHTEDAVSLRSDVEQLLEDCKNGIVRDVVWTDTLKDERREHKKVDVGKTRAFAAAPQHFVVAFRKYFLGFTAFLEHNRISNGICVGTNPFSTDWEFLYKLLTKHGPHVIAGDFVNFDGSLILQILWSCFYDIYIPWLGMFIDFSTEEGQGHYRTAMSLWAHIVNSVHICGDNFYMLTHSQPSGGPLTAILNCLYNLIIMRIAWIIIMKQKAPHNASMKRFNENVSMAVYGDDNVLNIAPRMIDLYNQETITEALATVGHGYTDEAKTGEVITTRTLDTVFFLKRGFRFDTLTQRHIAPLKKDVIYEMLNWTRNVVDPNTITMTNIEVAFREMYLHGPEAYQELKASIENVMDILPYRPQIPTFQECATEFVYQNHEVYSDYSDQF